MAIAGAAFAVDQVVEGCTESYSWRYKMTVTVETPEGDVSGSAVRQMGNRPGGGFPPETGNPADVRGEAVVVDLGKRGVLFALISHNSDMEFYNTFPQPGLPMGVGGSSAKGIQYLASLPIGTRGEVPSDFPPGYPKIVTFKDINDPKSVTLAQEWRRRDDGYYELKADHMETLFGEVVKLKEIILEITDEPVTWGAVKKHLGQRRAVGPYEFVKGEK